MLQVMLTFIDLLIKNRMNITSLIVDDEPLARARLENLVQKISFIQLIDEAKTGQEAIDKISELQPDLVFLDIQLKDMTGFDVLSSLQNKKMPLVIFITAFDQYALKAFDFFAFDYLLKPFTEERFRKAVNRVEKYFLQDNKMEFEAKINSLLEYTQTDKKESLLDKKLAIKTGKTISFVRCTEIKYITASGSYVDIHTEDKIRLYRASMNSILDKLNHANFVRVHRSTIINIDFLDKIISASFGEIDVKMKDGKKFRVSKSYRNDLKNILGV